ncbi:MAG TPA: ribbon-helix-helix protein, CopG family [Thermomicrobiales bacterium]|jgi:metal-responsive CopG/Arc/MetJ family transcriptional regulator
MTATLPSLTLSKDLLREIDEAAAETSLSREDLIRASVRTFLDQERRWRDLRRYGEERTRALGIHTEEELEAFLDAIDDEA